MELKAEDNKFKYSLREFLHQCRIHRNEDEFRRLVMEGYKNPNLLDIKSQGDEYHGQIIYHINEYGSYVGFFAEFLFLLTSLYYADDMGLVPYVHWGKDFLYYQEKKNNTIDNAFLYFFEQVSDIKEDASAAHVLTANDYHIQYVRKKLNTLGYAISEEYMDSLSKIIKKYIRYNEKTKLFLEKSYDDLIGKDKALAVHFRGTDYRRQYNNHPVFITIEQEIEEVYKILKEKDYEVIFLATDEQNAVNVFKKEFGDKVKVFEDTWRASEGNESVAYSHSNRENHHYLLGLEVLRDQYMLTRCDGLVCGISNLTLSARMMRKAWYNREYDDLIILDYGLCHNQYAFCDAKHT